LIVYVSVSPRLAVVDELVAESNTDFATAMVAVRTMTGAWPVVNVPTFVVNVPLL
jgi:hypothetical protein